MPRSYKKRRRTPPRPVAECAHCPRVGQIYARGLCETCYYDKDVRPLYQSKYPARRHWTTTEEALLKRMMRSRRPVREIAKILNRKVTQVHNYCSRNKIGYGRKKFRREQLDAFVARHSKAGVSDVSLARRFGVTRSTIARSRRRLGLPIQVCNGMKGRMAIEAIRRKYGYSTPSGRRNDEARKRAAEAGWPAGCTAGMHRVLEAIRNGPLPMSRIAASLGRSRQAVSLQVIALLKLGWVTRGAQYRNYPVSINWLAVRPDLDPPKPEPTADLDGSFRGRLISWHDGVCLEARRQLLRERSVRFPRLPLKHELGVG